MKKDKVLHLLAGLVVSCGGMFFAFPGPFGLGLAILAGIGKEVFDWNANRLARKRGLPRPHTVDFLDALATAAGGLPIFLWSQFA